MAAGAGRLRLAFMGTPDFAVPILAALYGAGHEIAAVYTQPPRPARRGHHLTPSPVQARAEALGLTVRHPTSLKTAEVQAEFAALDLDAAVIAAYGLILPAAILEAPRLGCLNVHASLLPRWRGAAPIHRAILAGDRETGITIMQMDAGLDTGGIILGEMVMIEPWLDFAGLHDRLAAVGSRLILEALDWREAGHEAVPQPSEGVTYAAKITSAEAQLDWRRDAAANTRICRALGGWFMLGEERIKVLRAEAEPGEGTPGTVIDDDLGIACGSGIFRPLLLQRPGRAAGERRAFLNGLKVPMGTILPCPATN
jgi:methionyl-tRNA formyltransferase